VGIMPSFIFFKIQSIGRTAKRKGGVMTSLRLTFLRAAIIILAKLLPVAITRGMVRQLEKLIENLNEKSQNFNRELGGPKSDVPKWWWTAKRYCEREKWRGLRDFGEAIYEDKLPCASPDWERFLNWVAVAARRTCDFDLSFKLFKDVVSNCTDKDVRFQAFVNLSGLYLRVGEIKSAKKSIDEALSIISTHDVALLTSLCVSSRARDLGACEEITKKLLLYYPEADNPKSAIGESILSDPDLRFFRSSEIYSQLLSGLANRRTLRFIRILKPSLIPSAFVIVLLVVMFLFTLAHSAPTLTGIL